MAYNNFYSQQLEAMSKPGGFQGDPSYQFARDEGLRATERTMSKQRGSGNALAALQQRASGLASQNYGAQYDRLAAGEGRMQQYDLGQTQNENTRTNNLNQYELGSRRADQDFQLGQGQLARGNQSDYWNYDLGRERNANDAAQQRNSWNQRGRSSGGYGGGSGFTVGSQGGRY